MNENISIFLLRLRKYFGQSGLSFFGWNDFHDTQNQTGRIWLILRGIMVMIMIIIITIIIIAFFGNPSATVCLTIECLTSQEFLLKLGWGMSVGVLIGLVVGVLVSLVINRSVEITSPLHYISRGIPYIVPIGMLCGIAGGLGLGISPDVAICVLSAIIFGVAVGVAGGMVLGIVLAIAFSLVADIIFHVAQISFREEPLGIVITIALIIMGGLIAVLITALIDKFWKPNRISKEWITGIVVLGIGSWVIGYSLSRIDWIRNDSYSHPNWSGGNEVWSLTVIFVVYFSRVLLWILECLCGVIGFLRFKFWKEPHSAEVAVSQYKLAYFDRHMWLPLFGESYVLRKLSEIDITEGIQQIICTANNSNHVLGAITALQKLAADNPLLIQSHLSRISDSKERDSLMRYTSFGMAPRPLELWKSKLDLDLIENRLHNRFSTKMYAEFASVRSELSQELSNIYPIWQVRREFPHSEQHYELYYELCKALNAEQVEEITQFQPPKLPNNHSVLYPSELVEMLTKLNGVRKSVQGYVDATSFVTKVGHIRHAQNRLKEIERTVRHSIFPAGSIVAIVASQWQKVIENALQEDIDEPRKTPYPQPYTIAEPVSGEKFIGRDDVMTRLESLWNFTDRRPSVFLYGHRRMGKTSILQNLSGERFGEETYIVDFNQQIYGYTPNTELWFYTLSQLLYDAWTRYTAKKSDLASPNEGKFLQGNPLLNFQQFLNKLNEHRQGMHFIVTLDEFEIIEEQMAKGNLTPHLIGNLRGVLGTHGWLTMIFSGLHTLHEMTHDYWQPFFGSVETIPVSFLTQGATRRLLTNPMPHFSIDYDSDAIEYIHELTNGQPYLTQLLGHTLIDRLNVQIFEERVKREARFNLSDVKSIIKTRGFYNSGYAYFSGVWEQASKHPIGQQDILKLLATSPRLSTHQLSNSTGLTVDETCAALKTLYRHDVIHKFDENHVDSQDLDEIKISDYDQWAYCVALMSAWVMRNFSDEQTDLRQIG